MDATQRTVINNNYEVIIGRVLRLVGHKSATLLSSLPPPFEQPRKYKQSREAPEYSR